MFGLEAFSRSTTNSGKTSRTGKATPGTGVFWCQQELVNHLIGLIPHEFQVNLVLPAALLQEAVPSDLQNGAQSWVLRKEPCAEPALQ